MALTFSVFVVDFFVCHLVLVVISVGRFYLLGDVDLLAGLLVTGQLNSD